MNRYLFFILWLIFFLSFDGLAKKKDVTEMSIKELDKEKKKGNADASFQLGEIFYKGLKGQTPNNYIAIQDYLNAAEKGHPGAQLWLGLRYEEGLKLLGKSESNAMSYFNKVLENPIIENYEESCVWKATAAMHLGRIYYDQALWPSENQEREFNKAIDYYKKAEVELNNCGIRTDQQKELLIDCYKNQIYAYYMKSGFCDQNFYVEELYYLKLAADLGDESSKYEYARRLYNGNAGITPNKAKAVKLFEDFYQNAQSDELRAESMFIVSSYYYENEDYPNAFPIFNILLENEGLFADARCYVLMKLASMYRFGRGVEQDIAKADELMQKAAEFGDPDAQKIQEWLNAKM